jgi:SOS-response transcriptional repressor LexA
MLSERTMNDQSKISPMSEGPAERLRAARIKAGYPQPIDAARAFGWNEHTYKSHENGTRGFKLPTARNYARAFRVTPSWLLFGQKAQIENSVREVLAVPLMGVVAAGAFQDIDYVPNDGAVVPAMVHPLVRASAQYAVKVQGPSVNLKIPDGMYAICAPLDSFPGGAKHGSLVHVERHRAGLVEHTIKELRRERTGTVLWPVSSHPDHQAPVDPNSPEEGTHVIIRGVVIGKFEPM